MKDEPRAKRHHLLLSLVLLAGTLAPDMAAQDPAAERLLRESERLEKAGDAAAALGELALLARQFPADRLAPAALLRIAELRRARGESAEAASALDTLLTDHPRSAEAARGLYLKAALLLAAAAGTEDLLEARNSFRRVALLFGRELYPQLDARRDALIASGEVALTVEATATAEADLVAALYDEPPGPAAGRARLSLARAWIAAGDWPAAAALLEEVAAGGDDVSRGATRERARRLASLLHRRVLRPIAGQRTWRESGRFPPSGGELREPSGVAGAGDGRLVVVDAKLPLVALFDAEGRELARVALGDVTRPGFLDAGPAEARSGTPFVVSSGGVTLPFDATSYSFADPRRSAPLRNLDAAAAGLFGDWFVAAKGFRSLLHVRGGREARELLAGQKPQIVDVARDGAGRVWALDARAGRVVRISRDGDGAVDFVTGDWKRPAALEVDELGYVYVLDRGNRRLDLFAPDGARQAQIGPDLGGGIALRNPVDVAVDGSGRIFIADTKLPFVVMLD